MWTVEQMDNLWVFLIENVDYACNQIGDFREGRRERSYLLTYQPIIRLFDFLLADEELHAEEKFPVLAGMVWGWMPTVLTVRNHHDWVDNYQSLREVRDPDVLVQQGQVEMLRHAFTIDDQGASLAGPSKMLHFANPQRYAIWDSNIIDRLNEIVVRDDIESRNDTGYLCYCSNFVGEPDHRAPQILAPINQTLEDCGYHDNVSLIRAIDMVLFNAPEDD